MNNEDEDEIAAEADAAADVAAASTPVATSLVAIVGRPNVGKSTLFNRLVGARRAIVEDRPGVTRDRLYGAVNHDGRSYLVVDTGGLDLDEDDGLMRHIRTQAEIAIAEADLILFVVDVAEGLSSDDREIAELLRRSHRPLLVVANKCDNPAREVDAHTMHELGLGEVFPVSAAHGRNTAELHEAILARLAHTAPEGSVVAVPEGTRIAFMGRPNAGKSTLINALLAEPRVIVDAEAGTTRDPIDLPFVFNGQPVVLIDTAGLRRRKQIDKAMEKLAAIKAVRTMERTQVVVLVLDASVGVTDQDQRIARMAHERGKGVVAVLNKWDLVARDKKAAHAVWAQAQDELAFLERPFLIKTSIVGAGRDLGQGRARGLDELLEACLHTAKALGRRISTADLNAELAAAVADHSPPMFGPKPVKLLFATQAESDPPLIVISANHGRCLSPAYERYLLRRFRTRWNLRGVPVRLVVRGRGKGNHERA
ncbi:ribosome biogenesis GTPase Der [Nannocystis sp.]|uniref:ribosome biogenesis GTPase Der n=1 Tax=Nannocystis sp. TaxID=1962667 RepID=UPI002424E0EA|nr:ribosome biogenesis GTPase Der [Nannocystis sp.]MBK7824082.1 ribosome biogenesis GTPase Der [Nannocystis sp.]MBK9755096.1 ribosome biogenesis GTPase Der [Nannocystis sp.]